MTPKATQKKDLKEDRLKKLAILAAGGKILHTKAQKEAIQIINERPPGMSFEEYKLLRRKQAKAIRNALR